MAKFNKRKSKNAPKIVAPKEQEFMSTGSLWMDHVLGGGFPTRRYTQIFGEPNSGKSTLWQITAKKYIEDTGGMVLVVDIENSFSPKWARSLGLTREMQENNMTIVESDLAENALQLVLDAVATEAYQLIIVDSLAAMESANQAEAELDKAEQMAGNAKLFTRYSRKLNIALKDAVKPITVIHINQARAKMDKYEKGKNSEPGGLALKHNSGLRLETMTPKDLMTPNGMLMKVLECRFNVMKQKSSDLKRPPSGEMGFKLVWDSVTSTYVLDNVTEILKIAKVADVFRTKEGGTWSAASGAYFNGELLGRGEATIIKAIASDEDFYKAVLNRVREVSNEQPSENSQRSVEEPEDGYDDEGFDFIDELDREDPEESFD